MSLNCVQAGVGLYGPLRQWILGLRASLRLGESMRLSRMVTGEAARLGRKSVPFRAPSQRSQGGLDEDTGAEASVPALPDWPHCMDIGALSRVEGKSHTPYIRGCLTGCGLGRGTGRNRKPLSGGGGLRPRSYMLVCLVSPQELPFPFWYLGHDPSGEGSRWGVCSPGECELPCPGELSLRA